MTIAKVTSVIYAAATKVICWCPEGRPDMADNLLAKPLRRSPGIVEQVRAATFPRQATVAPQARRFVTDAIGPHPAADDAVLLAGELVANSLLHAHDAATVTVAVAVSETFIRIDVCDDSRTGFPHWRQADGDAENGRGLYLVNLIAERWGFVREQARTCCWAEIAAGPATVPTDERTAS
jgi:anti-sigma regulatory factor (Ser/Thr protein kinase)